MKLLFNITDKEISSNEVKELLGFVDGDMSFENLLPDTITATKDIKKLIGEDVYNAVHKVYTDNLDSTGVYTNDFDKIDSNCVRSVRYPIIINAYSLFAPTNDLSHTNDGRRMRSADNEKMPFQWMTDANTKELEKRYYRACDDLIDQLDNSAPHNYASLSDANKQKTIYYKWINCLAYKKCKDLFINSVDAFNEVFQIESRLVLIKLASGLRECEQREIMPRITQEKYDTIKAAAPTTPEGIRLLILIKEACVFYSLAWAIPRFSVSIFPEGTLQFMVSDRTTTNAKKPAMYNETEYAMQYFKQSYQRALLDIELLMAPESIAPTIVYCSVNKPISTDDVGFSAM